MRGVRLSTALRRHARCMWRPERARHVDNTAIRRAPSPWRTGGSDTAEVHGCPRGVAPLRHHPARRNTPVAPHGRRNDSIASHASCGEARPRILLLLPGHDLATPRCSSAALAMTADERHGERGRQEVEETRRVEHEWHAYAQVTGPQYRQCFGQHRGGDTGEPWGVVTWCLGHGAARALEPAVGAWPRSAPSRPPAW